MRLTTFGDLRTPGTSQTLDKINRTFSSVPAIIIMQSITSLVLAIEESYRLSVRVFEAEN
jgi:hypothetical protein